ncbi:MAG: Gfo/Idh/MocA family oxidoreductase [Methanomicrobiales archaeon]|nr:Gfo/Idh/MocA family oxidoreductase [Methanomicrobiales archaeon]
MDVGVIGVGAMGRNHARVYSELRDVSSLHIFDLNREAKERIAAEYGGVASASMEDLLRQVDAVSVCVPTRFHYDVASQVLARGVNVLIEKPLCASAQQGIDLLPSIPEDLTVGVGHIERFNPIVEEVRRIIRKPLYVELKRHNPASNRVTDSSVVEDLMIHDIDIVFNILFDGAYTLSSAGSTDLCTTLIRIGSIPIVLSASRKAAKKIRSIYIEEEDCTIEGNFMTQEIVVYRRPDQFAVENQRYVQESVIETVMVNKVEPLKLELSTFLCCAKAGKPFPVTPAQGIRNIQICEQIRKGW